MRRIKEGDWFRSISRVCYTGLMLTTSFILSFEILSVLKFNNKINSFPFRYSGIWETNCCQRIKISCYYIFILYGRPMILMIFKKKKMYRFWFFLNLFSFFGAFSIPYFRFTGKNTLLSLANPAISIVKIIIWTSKLDRCGLRQSFLIEMRQKTK